MAKVTSTAAMGNASKLTSALLLAHINAIVFAAFGLLGFSAEQSGLMFNPSQAAEGLWDERFSRCYSMGLAAGAGFGLVRGIDSQRAGGLA